MSGMRSIPLDEVWRLLPCLPPKYACLTALGVATGCRISELLLLRRNHLLLPDGRLRDEIAFPELKKRRTAHRKMALPEVFRRHVTGHLVREERLGYDRPDGWVFRGRGGRHLSRTQVYRFFRERLGRGHGTHWMRKTFAQLLFRYLEEESGDVLKALETTRRALDHERIDTTIRYLGLREQEIKNAQEAIFCPSVPIRNNP